MELAGTSWILVDFETDMGVIPALTEAPATLDFSAESDRERRLSMMCNPDQMAQEDRFLQALATAGPCEMSNGELLIGYTGGTLRFAQTT